MSEGGAWVSFSSSEVLRRTRWANSETVWASAIAYWQGRAWLGDLQRKKEDRGEIVCWNNHQAVSSYC